MDLATLLTSVTAAAGVSAATAGWLSKSLISHRLSKDLEEFKSRLEQNRAEIKVALEGQIHQAVETLLGDRAADRQYSAEAKRRLYTAIGPLRFQLLLACRDLAGRISRHGLGVAYDLSVDEYYGRSTLFRILRPLALGELIERQIAYADFSVDAGAVDLLRFKKNAFAVFSGDSLVHGHSRVDWTRELEHVVFDALGSCASALVVREGDGRERPMRFHEFDAFVEEPESKEMLTPFPFILEDFTPQGKPLFWLRLVAYGYLCTDFVNRTGRAIGFEEREYPVSKLLMVSEDSQICGSLDEYVRRCERLPSATL